MKLAALQMTSCIDVATNLATAASLLAEAAAGGACLALLPENFSFMGRREADKRSVSEEFGSGPVQDFLAEQARKLGIMVIGGTLPLRVPGETRSAQACLAFAADGSLAGRYDKIHLFDVDLPGREESYRESSGMVPGREVVVIETPAGKAGLSICYDMRFPELYRQLSARGAQLLMVPAAFTVPTGRAHWDVLLRARAVENLCTVVAAGQWGTHENGRETWGHSQIIDCWGEIRATLPEGTGCVMADFDPAHQADVRTRFPALSHRVLV